MRDRWAQLFGLNSYREGLLSECIELRASYTLGPL